MSFHTHLLKLHSGTGTHPDTVLFEFTLSVFFLKVFKMPWLGGSLHTLLKNVSFPSPTDMGSHNPPPLGPTSSLGLIPPSNRCDLIIQLPSRLSVLAGTPHGVHSLSR